MVLDTHVMRLALASVALICGAATCLAKSPTSKYCSYGFDETGDAPAELVFFENGPEFRLGGKTKNLAEGNPTWVEYMTFGKIDYWTEGIEYRDQKIIIYMDRAFWPCRRN